MEHLTKPAVRFEALDLIRGVCALAVVVYHYLAWRHDVVISSMGTFGVYVFFILSALALMIRYGDDFKTAIGVDKLREFAVARVARIIPLLAAVAAVRAVFFYSRGDSLSEVLPEAFLTGSALMGLHLPVHLSNAIGAWSLGIEAAFYLVFPLAALACGQLSTRSLLVTLGVLLIAQHSLLITIREIPQFSVYYTTPLTFAPFFMIGFLIFRLPRQPRARSLAAAAISLAAVFAFSLAFEGDPRKLSVEYAVLTVLAGLAVYFAYGSLTPAALKGPALFLGNISYALYLTHGFVYRGVDKAVQRGIIPEVLQPVAFFAAAIALAWVIYAAFEAPARTRVRRWFGASAAGRRPATAP